MAEGENVALTKDGQDIEYVRMALDLYRDTDFPDDLGSPFAT